MGVVIGRRNAEWCSGSTRVFGTRSSGSIPGSAVDRDGDTLVLRQQCTKEEEAGGVLETVFEDGMIKRTQTLRDIRHRLHGDGF